MCRCLSSVQDGPLPPGEPVDPRADLHATNPPPPIPSPSCVSWSHSATTRCACRPTRVLGPLQVADSALGAQVRVVYGPHLLARSGAVPRVPCHHPQGPVQAADFRESGRAEGGCHQEADEQDVSRSVRSAAAGLLAGWRALATQSRNGVRGMHSGLREGLARVA